MTVRLHYMGHTLEVPEGEFIVGRSSGCQLSLDDPRVSRQHAVLTVTAGSATIEDLGSRNGVLVNKRKISGSTSLADGDVITIGSQEMTIQGIRAAPRAKIQRRSMFDTMTAMPPDALADEMTTTTNVQASLNLPDKRVHELSLIGAVAEKALQLGRADDASRLLERAMKDMLARAQRLAAGEEAEPLDENAVRRAVTLGLRLAEAATEGGGAWVDFVIELHHARGELLSAPTIDTLYSVIRNVKPDVAKLRAYVETLNAGAGNMTNNEKFLLSRIEGLVALALV